MVRILLLACLFFCAHTYATNLLRLASDKENIDLANIAPKHNPWNASSVYIAGDVVSHNENLFVAMHWIKGIEPVKNTINRDGWIWVQNSGIEKWQPAKVYQGGDLVKSGTDYFLARYWNENHEPKTNNSWQRIRDLFYVDPKLPPVHPDDYKTLDGVDQNSNGIRDDYERVVYEKFDSPELITFSLAAAPTLQLVIDVEQNRFSYLDEDIGKKIILDFVNISMCTRVLQTNFPHFRNPKLLYFNTLERAFANRTGQNKIHDLIPWDDDFHYSADKDCGALTGVAH